MDHQVSAKLSNQSKKQIMCQSNWATRKLLQPEHWVRQCSGDGHPHCDVHTLGSQLFTMCVWLSTSFIVVAAVTKFFFTILAIIFEAPGPLVLEGNKWTLKKIYKKKNDDDDDEQEQNSAFTFHFLFDHPINSIEFLLKWSAHSSWTGTALLQL